MGRPSFAEPTGDDLAREIYALIEGVNQAVAKAAAAGLSVNVDVARLKSTTGGESVSLTAKVFMVYAPPREKIAHGDAQG